MADQQTPELLRLSLQDLAIRVKICKLGGIEETLSQALDPPSAKNIRRAVDALIDVRALTAGENLTPLGVQLARLPLDVFLGKLILYSNVWMPSSRLLPYCLRSLHSQLPSELELRRIPLDLRFAEVNLN
jgi:HrpA-like RNA helicase